MQGIVEGAIEWPEDPGFGYEVATAIPGVDDIEMLPRRRLYARQDRTDEHAAMAARLKRKRKEFLNSFSSFSPLTSPSSSGSADERPGSRGRPPG